MSVHDVARLGTDLRSRRVLLISEAQTAADAVLRLLNATGCYVSVVPGRQAAAELLASRQPDLVVIDETYASIEIWVELRRLRNRNPALPILVVNTGEAKPPHSRARLVEADAYLSLPITVAEFASRIVDMTDHRTAARAARPELLTFGEIVVDLAAGTVQRRGTRVQVTPKEFYLLVALYRAHGRLVSRSELLERVWNYAPGLSSRAVDTVVCALRKKLEDDPSRPRYLVTVPRRGYRLDVWTDAERHASALRLTAGAA